MHAIGRVDIGRKRSRNEDAIFVSDTPVGILPNLYIVADGMGGHQSGAIASKLAIEGFCEYIRTHGQTGVKTREDVTILLKMGIRHANYIVYEKSKTADEYTGMGTTFTVATVIDDILYIAHVGDTRLYLVNESKIYQATTDHSLVQEMLEQGCISKSELQEHPKRHIITRAVGTYAKIKVDTVMYDINNVKYILLCSDGLNVMLNDEEVHQIIYEEKEIDHIVNRLIDTANARGGIDNIAVIIAKKYEVSKEC